MIQKSVLTHPRLPALTAHHDELRDQIHIKVPAGTQLGLGLLAGPEPLEQLGGRCVLRAQRGLCQASGADAALQSLVSGMYDCRNHGTHRTWFRFNEADCPP